MVSIMNDKNLLEDQPIAWTPSPEVIERAQITRFMKQVGVSTWDELYQYSINDVERFTADVLKFLDIKFDPPYEKLLDTTNGIEFPQWFTTPQRHGDAEMSEPDATESPASRQSEAESTKEETRPVGSVPHAGLNITEMCLDRWQTDEMRDQPAVIWEGEAGASKTLSYVQLMDNVTACENTLVDLGLGYGDAIGVHLPMLPETVVALLAINRIGGIAVPVFSGYGIDAITSRMEAVGAKALFTCFGTSRRGKSVDMLTVAARAVANVASIRSVILIGGKGVPELGIEGFVMEHERLKKDVFGARNLAQWGVDRDLFAFLGDARTPAKTAAEDPLIILYTSGTTGKPKGIAHTHASFPIKAAQDMAFGTDVGKGTRISWYTDIGWMMGPWLIYGALINGATICIYDGAPDYPTPDRMWEFCAKHKVEILGISPTLIRALAAAEGTADTPVRSARTADTLVRSDENIDPRAGSGGSQDTPIRSDSLTITGSDKSVRAPFERHDLSSLRAFASTGEPWNPAPWWWLFENVGNSKLPIINYSGGTEISGGILMGNMLLPQKPCSFPAPCPGMDVDIFDEEGNSVEPGKVGELVIKQPWIGMARGFWQDNERYLETYWSRFKNIWVHGDWAMRDDDGHWFILGRSDDTLKVAGKRVGPAEVESILVAHPKVTEAAVIGVPDEAKGTAMVVFVVLNDEGRSLLNDEGRMMNDESQSADSSFIPHPSSLASELRSLVARDMGKPLTPSRIHFVSALPKTRNAKVMRRVIRSSYLGEDPGDLSALEDPHAVKEIGIAGKG